MKRILGLTLIGLPFVAIISVAFMILGPVQGLLAVSAPLAFIGLIALGFNLLD